MSFGLSEMRCCDKCCLYTTCYYGDGLNIVVCKYCLLKMNGGKQWLESFEWHQEAAKLPEPYKKYDVQMNDWTSTMPGNKSSLKYG